MKSKLWWGVALLLMVFVVAFSGCTDSGSGDNSSENNSGSENTSVALQEGNVTGADAYIKITYPGDWGGEIKTYVNGSVETSGNTKTYNGGSAYRDDVSGSGDKIYSLMGDLTGLELSISKSDQGTGNLKVELIIDGKVVKTEQVSDVSGTVILSYGESIPIL